MKHYIAVLSCTPNKPNSYRAICGYESTDENEFNKVTEPSMKGVTCPACLEKLKNSMVIIKETDL